MVLSEEEIHGLKERLLYRTININFSYTVHLHTESESVSHSVVSSSS